VAERLREAGHDAARVRDYGMQAVSDEQIFQRAGQEDRVPRLARSGGRQDPAHPAPHAAGHARTSMGVKIAASSPVAPVLSTSLVQAVRSVVNPEKLRHLGPPADLRALLATRRRPRP
jgi:hypothetical protein